MPIKSIIFELGIQKNGIYVVKQYTNNTHITFQSNIVIFRCAMAKKRGKGDDVTFL